MKNTLVRMARALRRPIAMLLALMLIVSLVPHTAVIAAEGTAATTVKACLEVKKESGEVEGRDKYTYTPKLTVGEESKSSDFTVKWPGDSTETTYTSEGTEEVSATITYDGLTLTVSAGPGNITEDGGTGTGAEVTWGLSGITLEHVPNKNEWTIKPSFTSNNCNISESATFKVSDANFTVEGTTLSLKSATGIGEDPVSLTISVVSGDVTYGSQSVSVSGIDRTGPESVTASLGESDQLDKQYYKNTEQKITISVEDDDFDHSSNKSCVKYKINGGDQTKNFESKTLEISVNNGETLSDLSAELYDINGNMTPEQWTNFKVTVDDGTSNKVELGFAGEGTYKEVGETKYYQDSQKITITVTSKLFNKDNVTIKATVGEGEQEISGSNLTWSDGDGDDTHTTTITITDESGNGKIKTGNKPLTEVKVTGTDLAGNNINSSKSDLNIIVDSQDPKVTITDSNKGNTGVIGSEQTFIVEVDDINFNPEKSTIKIGSSVFTSSAWKTDSDGKYSMEITLSDKGSTATTGELLKYVTTGEIGNVTVHVEDNAGRPFDKTENLDYTVDTTPVKVEINAPTDSVLTYYNSIKTITVTATDVNFDTSSEVIVTYDNGKQEHFSNWSGGTDGVYTIAITVSDQETDAVNKLVTTKAITKIEVTAKDKAGNGAEDSTTSVTTNFIVDTVDPVINDIQLPSNVNDGKEGYDGTSDHYNKAKDIVVTVTDTNFDTTKTTITVEGKNGKPLDVQGTLTWQTDGTDGKHTATITIYDQKPKSPTGAYIVTDEAVTKVTVNAVDLAGRTRDNDKSNSIVVDTIDPVVNIELPKTDNVPANEGTSFFQNKQTITITVTSKNFNQGKTTVKYKLQGDNEGKDLNVTWNHNGSVHTATIIVGDDAVEGANIVTTDKPLVEISVYTEDYAGHKGVAADGSGLEASNGTVSAKANLIVDTTKPEVQVTMDETGKGDKNGNTDHYKTDREIKVTVTDLFFDAENSYVEVYVNGQNDPKTFKFTGSTLTITVTDNNGEKSATDAGKNVVVTEGQAVTEVKVYAVDIAKWNGEKAGEDGKVSKSYNFIVDTTKPKVKIEMPDETEAPKDNEVSHFGKPQTITLTVTSTNFYEKETKVYYTLQDGTEQELTVTWKPGDVAGVYTATITVDDATGKGAQIVTTNKALVSLRVQTKDYAGNLGEPDGTGLTGDANDSITAKANFIVDTTTPKVSITMGENGKGTPNGETDHYKTNREIEVAVDDLFFDAAKSYVEVYVDGQSTPNKFDFTGKTMTITVTDEEGNKNATGNVVVTEGKAVTAVKVYAIDIAGLTGDVATGTTAEVDGEKKVSKGFNFLVDTTTPKVKIDMPDETEAPQGNGASHFGTQQTITLTVTSTNFYEDVTEVYYKLQDGEELPLEVTWQPGAAGVHTATITVGDEAVEGADIVTTNKQLVEIKVYTRDYAGNLGEADGTALEDDKAGNITASANFIVDTTDPTAEIVLPEGGTPHGDISYFSDEQKEITVTITEWNLDKDNVTVTVTGGEDGTYTFPGSGLAWTDSADGLTHTVTITVTDNSGEGMVVTGTAPVTNVKVNFNDFIPEHAQENNAPTSFVVDHTAPTISIDAPAGGTYYDENQTVTVTVTDINLDTASSTVTVQGQSFSGSRWNDRGNGVYVLTLSLSDVQSSDVAYDGQFGDVSVSVVDYALNEDSDTRTLGFWIDTVDPVVSVTVPSDPVNTSGGINYYDAEQTITFTAEDTNLESAEVTVEVNGQTLTFPMTNSLTLTVSDLMNADVQTLDGALMNVTVTAYDRAGRSTTAGEAPSMIVDTIDPVVTASLSGNIQTVFYTVENGRRIYYLVPNRLITSDTEDGELNEDYVMTLTVTDKNIAIGDTTDANGYIMTYTSDGGTESWVRDGDVYTLTKSVPVSRNETGVIRFDTRIIDLSGNAAQETVYAVLTGNGEGGIPSVITMAFDETGRTSVDARIDRRQSSTSFVDEIPLIDIVPNVEHRGIAMNTAGLPVYDGTFHSFGLTVYDGRDQGDDVFNNSGISRIVWTLNDGIGGGFLSTANGDNSFSSIVDNQLSGEQVFEHSFTIPITVNGQNETNAAILTVMMVDNVGNEIYREFAFAVDTQAPRVTVEYNNNDVANGVYFKSGRTATVTVTDKNFDPADPTLSEIATQVGDAEWQRISDGVYITTRTYNTDGDYTLAVQIGDRSGNVTPDGNVSYAGEAVKEFTVDTTAPVIDVRFDNTAVTNNRYYNANRTATVTITEHNFDQEQGLNVPVTASLNGEPMAAPQASAFSVGSDEHVATVQFLTDGDYTIGVEYTDLAGNVATAYVGDPFTIDTVAPEIVITGVGSVNTDTAAPVITFTDVNFDSQGYFTDITFFRMLQAASADLARSDSGADTSGVVVTFTDIPHVKSSDGIYELTARATDLAGNEAEPVTLLFSVNRFGSTYYTEDPGTVGLISSRYTKSNQPLQIVEINPNPLVEHSVTMAVNGQTITLTEGVDYTVSSEGNGGIGYRYTYNLAASAFEENGALREGSYVLTFYSEDDAGNVNSNRSNSTVDEDGEEDLLDLSFVIDATAPVVSITGVAAGDRIQEASREVTVYFTDGNEIADVTVYLNGEVHTHISREELAGYGGQFTFTVTEQNADQTVRVVVLDAADNQVDTGDIQFYMNSSAFNQFVHNRPLFYGSIAGVVAVAGGGGAAAVVLLKRKKRAKVSK